MSLREEYEDYCLRFKKIWNYLSKCSKPLDEMVSDICKIRLYFGAEERWGNLFSEIGLAYVSEETCDYSKMNIKEYEDLGLFSEDEYFLLNERYIIPIRDMLGNIIALVGWYPDNKKYITTASKFFSKDCLFFGMEQLSKTGLGKPYFLVEGIFDCLSLRSLGFNAVAQMGINASRIKEYLYGMFGKLIGVPDNDTQGRGVLKSNKWRLPSNASYLRWSGNLQQEEESAEETEDEGNKGIQIKDIDKICNLFEEDDVKDMLNSCINERKRVIKIELS